jgi:hypothetical protein
MKKIITLITLILAFNSFAFEKYVCQEYDRDTQNILSRTIVLEPTGKPSDHLGEDGEYESTKIPYAFTLFDGLDTFRADSEKGTVFTEDVYFRFESSESDVTFELYLDEMEEGYLNLAKGSETVYFVCR